MAPNRVNQKPQPKSTAPAARAAHPRNAAAASNSAEAAAPQQDVAPDEDVPVTRRGTRRVAIPQPARGRAPEQAQEQEAGDGAVEDEETMDVDDPPALDDPLAPRRSARQALAQASGAAKSRSSASRSKSTADKGRENALSKAQASTDPTTPNDAMDVDEPSPPKKSKSNGNSKAAKSKATMPAQANDGDVAPMDVDEGAARAIGKRGKAKSSTKERAPRPAPSPTHPQNADLQPSSRPASGRPSSVGGPARHLASVSQATVGGTSTRQVLAFVEVPRLSNTSRTRPHVSTGAPSFASPPSGPPPSDDGSSSEDSDPSPNFQEAGGDEDDATSADEDGYATPTPRPRKRPAAPPGSPSLAVPKAKRVRNDPQPPRHKPPQPQAPSTPSFGAAAQDLFADDGDLVMRSPSQRSTSSEGEAGSRGPSPEGRVGSMKKNKPQKGSKGSTKGKGKAKAKGKGKGKGRAKSGDGDESDDDAEQYSSADDESSGGESDSSSSSGESDDSNQPRFTAQEKGKGKAPIDDGAAGPSGASRKDKGKGKAPADDDAPPLTAPGLFNPGDYLEDDAELPPMEDLFSFAQQDDPNAPGPSTRTRTPRTQRPSEDVPPYASGRLPEEARSRAEEHGVQYIAELQAIAQEYNKPLDVVFRLAGWMHSDSAHARRWQRANVFRRYWASTTPVDPEVSSEERRAQMDAAYRAKMAELGPNPTTDQLMDHFKKEYDYCVEMDRHLIENATSRQRQRQIDALAQQFSRLALAANLNNGVAVVGYIVDLHARAHTGMFGGGAVYDELLRRYSGNFTRGLEDVSTMLRACDLRLRGLSESGEPNAAALEDPEEGWFPVRDWSLDPNQNKSDEYLRILYELLRWDLGAIYRMANERLSSRHTAKDPRQFPRTAWPDIAYRLGICLVNWPEALRRNMPKNGLKRKPAGRTWSSLVASMVNYRRRAEADSNRRGLEGEEALRHLHGLGVPVLSPLPRDYALLPFRRLSHNPIVQSPRPPQSVEPRLRRPTPFLTWRDSARYLKDRANGDDSRIKWQLYWGAERNNGLVNDDASDTGVDARASMEGVSIENVNNPPADSFNNWWAPWDRAQSASSRLSRLQRLQLSDDDGEEGGDWEDLGDEGEDGDAAPASAREDALRRLKAARHAKRRASTNIAGPSKTSKSSKSSKGEGPSQRPGSSKDKSDKDKSDKPSKGGSKRK